MEQDPVHEHSNGWARECRGTKRSCNPIHTVRPPHPMAPVPHARAANSFSPSREPWTKKKEDGIRGNHGEKQGSANPQFHHRQSFVGVVRPCSCLVGPGRWTRAKSGGERRRASSAYRRGRLPNHFRHSSLPRARRAFLFYPVSPSSASGLFDLFFFFSAIS
jgi:hypothetical protein